MNKPVKHQRDPIFDFHEIISYIEHKHQIDIRDCKKSHGHFQTYQDTTGDRMPCQYPDCSGLAKGFEQQYVIYRDGQPVAATKQQYDADFKLIHDHFKRYQQWTKENPEPPYLDYWHWLLEHCFIGLYNGEERVWNLKEILEDEDSPDWVKEITELVYNEFESELDEEGSLEVIVGW